MRFQQKERRFHSGKKRRAKDQNRDRSQHNGQSGGTHFWGSKPLALWAGFPFPGTQAALGRPSEELVFGGLLIL